MKIFSAAAALLGLVVVATTTSAFSPSPAAKTGELSSRLASTTTKVLFDDVAVEAPPTVPATSESPLVPTTTTLTGIMSQQEDYVGEKSVFRENTYTFVSAEELAYQKQRIPNPSSFAERQTRPVSLIDIRNQQVQHGLHTTSNYDTTRNCLRN